MKALVYHGPGQRVWESVSDPTVLAPTDAIVGIDSSTICGTDLHIPKSDTPETMPGTILGHEAVGTVVQVGTTVSRHPPPRLSRHRSSTRPKPRPSNPPPTLVVPAEVVLRVLDIDALSAHWRLVFNAAEDAVRAASHCGTSLGFAQEELHGWSIRLVQERAATAQLLDEVAQQDHVHLYHQVASPRATRRTLGLPGALAACVFDLDGILTTSGALHAAAWAETFDELLARRAESTGERFAPFRPFDPRVDYSRHIDGRPRLDGIHAFLASRGIRLPEGKPEDPSGSETIYGLANRKNEALLRCLEREGVTAFAGASGYLEAAHEAGLSCAVVSASANTNRILERAGLASLVDQCVDGNTIRAEQLAPKPAPDTVLAACRRLGVTAEHAAAFETTIDGVIAARAAGFGLVVAVDRAGRAEMLSAHGADLVISDLAALLELKPTG